MPEDKYVCFFFHFSGICCFPQIKSNVNREAKTIHRWIYVFWFVLISFLILCQLRPVSVGPTLSGYIWIQDNSVLQDLTFSQPLVLLAQSSQIHFGPESCFSYSQWYIDFAVSSVEDVQMQNAWKSFPCWGIRRAESAADIISLAAFTRPTTLEIRLYSKSLKGQSHLSKSVPCAFACVLAAWSLVCLLVSWG